MNIEHTLFSLSKAEKPSDILLAWKTIGGDSKKYKAIVSLEKYDKEIYPLKLKELVNSQDNDFVSYFKTEKLYFVDDELLNEIFTSAHKKVEFLIDYSVMFDTNYASYIHRFVNSDYTSFNNEIFKTISILIREDFQYDYWFYLIENHKNIVFDKNLDLRSFQNNYKDMYDNLVSLELFKSIDSQNFRAHGRIIYSISKEIAVQNTDYLIKNLFLSHEGKSIFEHFLLFRKRITLFLIGMLKIHFGSNKSPANKLSELFIYMNDVVNVYFDRETIVAHNYFKKKGNLLIFRKIQKNGDISKLLNKIENISYDFLLPRVMEYFTKLQSEGRYFIPFALSHDDGLQEMLDLYNVKGVFFDDGTPIPLTKVTNIEYFKNENCKIDFNHFFSNESIKKRKKLADKQIDKIDQLINDNFQELMKIMS